MLTKCESCGRFFGAEITGQTHCSTCKPTAIDSLHSNVDQEEQKFIMARGIVYEMPDITPKDLVDEMDDRGVEITRKEIMEYVRNGRLTLKNNPDGTFCEDCGRTILSGRLCPRCTANFEKAIKNRNKSEVTGTRVIKTNDSDRKAIKMHTKNNIG